MLDRSGSMQENFWLVELRGRRACALLLPADKARIGTFAAKIMLEPEEFTTNQQTLVNILRGEMQTERSDAALERGEQGGMAELLPGIAGASFCCSPTVPTVR